MKKKKIRAIISKEASFTKAMDRIKGKAVTVMISRLRSNLGFSPNTPPVYCPKTPVNNARPESIPPTATLSQERIWKEVYWAI